MEYALEARKEISASMIVIAMRTYIASGDQMQDSGRACMKRGSKIKESTANQTIGALAA